MFSRVLLFSVVSSLPGAATAGPILSEAARTTATRAEATQQEVFILPEPASLFLMGLGLAMLAWRARRLRT